MPGTDASNIDDNAAIKRSVLNAFSKGSFSGSELLWQSAFCAVIICALAPFRNTGFLKETLVYKP